AVLCGPGNNGGDGFVIARLLREFGWEVRVFFLGTTEKLGADARANHDRWSRQGAVAPLTAGFSDTLPAPDILVDAVFGVGANRALPTEVASALSLDAFRVPSGEGADMRRVAVDIPSGLLSDVGVYMGGGPRLARADLTVTFHSPKLGHYLADGPSACGKLSVADIGLRGAAGDRAEPGQLPDAEHVRLAEPVLTHSVFRRAIPPRDFAARHLSKPDASPGQHKYDHGSVLVFGGGVGKGGAARLAARAALRVGAGLVTLSVPPAALQENACQLNAIMLRADRDADAYAARADDRVTGYCLGPGLGVGERTRDLVATVAASGSSARHPRKPVVVLDADGLTSFEANREALFEVAHERFVLTPHTGEFARLFPDLAADLRGSGLSKIDAVRRAADRAGCVVLLKGADTVIAAPGGPCAVSSSHYDRAAPWLSTAGAGDVLAGLIVGLAASPASPPALCCTEFAAWLHVECARAFGPGLIAEDLPDMVPRVLRGMGL
ncbi:MAG: NAD(P)H-hydrate dehydratase, partial [Pseudomonadota bacterium]